MCVDMINTGFFGKFGLTKDHVNYYVVILKPDTNIRRFNQNIWIIDTNHNYCCI